MRFGFRGRGSQTFYILSTFPSSTTGKFPKVSSITKQLAQFDIGRNIGFHNLRQTKQCSTTTSLKRRISYPKFRNPFRN